MTRQAELVKLGTLPSGTRVRVPAQPEHELVVVDRYTTGPIVRVKLHKTNNESALQWELPAYYPPDMKVEVLP